MIDKITGRQDDVLVTPEGKYVGRLDPIFKGMSNCIRETQIIQKRIDYVEIQIVRADGYLKEHGQALIAELKKRMGNTLTYKINYTESIPRTSSGKLRAVINLVEKINDV